MIDHTCKVGSGSDGVQRVPSRVPGETHLKASWELLEVVAVVINPWIACVGGGIIIPYYGNSALRGGLALTIQSSPNLTVNVRVRVWSRPAQGG